MNTAVINIKIDPVIKKKAQKIVAELGLSLSSFIDAQLRQLVRTKSVTFGPPEVPSAWMKRELAKSRADIKAGRVLSFGPPHKALEYIDGLIADHEHRHPKS